jgi:hypothetical protein
MRSLISDLYETLYFTLTEWPQPISRIMFWIDAVISRIQGRIYDLESWDEWEQRIAEEVDDGND